MIPLDKSLTSNCDCAEYLDLSQLGGNLQRLRGRSTLLLKMNLAFLETIERQNVLKVLEWVELYKFDCQMVERMCFTSGTMVFCEFIL